ncbi:MAG: polysaccharide deacetylase family protein [Dethiobacteria bacterium]|nr:polysaccharide deacetylase family protein [Bacillota bacterium]MDW7729620.1 polysaccharide deacetylase family protein [Bacillota bacterium]
MADYSYRSNRQPKSKSGSRIFLFLVLLVIIAALGIFSFTQYLAIQSLQSDLELFRENLNQVETENQQLRQRYDDIIEENEKLREENHMLRSSTIINHGNRDTNKVAITIDDGAGPELINQTLAHLRDYDVKATFFPMGSWVERYPEIWQQAIEDGHELGNHTYNHAFLTTISEDRVREELTHWQEAVDEALGYNYKTLFFRPPGMDGFTSINSNKTKQLQEIIANKGMFPILWDIELVYALRNESYTTARVTEHVLANARGGSIVLLHFTHIDIAALPAILSGLRNRGLEPCSLSELLLVDFKL